MNIIEELEIMSKKSRAISYPNPNYRQEIEAINLEARRAMEKEEGVSKDHPKANLLWKIAWEMGHSSGYYEIWGYYQMISPLIK